MALTDAEIRALEAPAKRIQVADGNGLSLDIMPSGKKTWLYRYRLNQEYGRVALGRYLDLSLKAARKKRDESWRARWPLAAIRRGASAETALDSPLIRPWRSLASGTTRSRS
jgi:Arm DNA-binding domain